MPKTGRTYTVLFTLILGLLAVSAQANDVRVVTSFSETRILTGERVTIRIEVRGDSFRNVSRPTLPALIPGLRSISVQPSTSTQYSLINGVATRSYSYTWSFVAETAGTFEFPSVTVTVDGDRMQTEPVSYTIVDRNNPAGNQQGTAQQGSAGQQRPDIYVQMEVSEQNPVVGQQIFADLVIYFRNSIEIVSYQTGSSWATDGFWKENLSDGSSPQAESVILGGERYRKAVLLRHALFASRSGPLTIGEATVTTTLRTGARANDPFGSFFGGFGTNQRTVELKTQPVEVTVRRLPDAGNRTTIGAVGNFTMTRRITPSTVTTGEALEIITEISGNGNLALISKPEYELPDVFEVFQPQENLNLNRSVNGLSGTRTFRDIMIVRRPGTYEIPATQMAYYNPDRRSYVTVTLPAGVINVAEDAGAAVTSTREQRLGVGPVSGVVRWRPVAAVPVWEQWWLYAGVLVPMLLLVLAWKKKQEDDRLRNDTSYARRVRAGEAALAELKRLRELAGQSGDVKQVMAGIHTVVYRVVTDRLDLPEAGHSDQDILRYLREKNVDQAVIRQVERILTKCSTIRFAPVTARENLSYELEQAQVLVRSLTEAL